MINKFKILKVQIYNSEIENEKKVKEILNIKKEEADKINDVEIFLRLKFCQDN